MECIRNLVNQRYHRLILKDQPNLNMLLSMDSMSLDDSKASKKILNGPEISRETNQSETDTVNSIHFVFHITVLQLLLMHSYLF